MFPTILSASLHAGRSFDSGKDMILYLHITGGTELLRISVLDAVARKLKAKRADDDELATGLERTLSLSNGKKLSAMLNRMHIDLRGDGLDDDAISILKTVQDCCSRIWWKHAKASW
jgi:hypothetical protein